MHVSNSVSQSVFSQSLVDVYYVYTVYKDSILLLLHCIKFNSSQPFSLIELLLLLLLFLLLLSLFSFLYIKSTLYKIIMIHIHLLLGFFFWNIFTLYFFQSIPFLTNNTQYGLYYKYNMYHFLFLLLLLPCCIKEFELISYFPIHYCIVYIARYNLKYMMHLNYSQDE